MPIIINVWVLNRVTGRPGHSEMHEINYLDPLELGNSALDGILNTGLEGHGRHRAASTITNKFKAKNIFPGNLKNSNVPAIRFQIGPDAVE